MIFIDITSISAAEMLQSRAEHRTRRLIKRHLYTPANEAAEPAQHGGTLMKRQPEAGTGRVISHTGVSDTHRCLLVQFFRIAYTYNLHGHEMLS